MQDRRIGLVGKQAEMTPGADLVNSSKAGVGLALIDAVLRLADHEGRIANAEIQSVFVALLLVAGTWSGRVAIKDRNEKGPGLVGLDLQPHAGSRQRKGGPAARQVLRGDRRPIALQKEIVADLAEEEFR